HERAVVPEVRWPPGLRGGHHGGEVLLDRGQVQARELLAVIERRAERVRLVRVLRQELERKLVRPPITVRRAMAMRDRAGPGGAEFTHRGAPSVADRAARQAAQMPLNWMVTSVTWKSRAAGRVRSVSPSSSTSMRRKQRVHHR